MKIWCLQKENIDRIYDKRTLREDWYYRGIISDLQARRKLLWLVASLIIVTLINAGFALLFFSLGPIIVSALLGIFCFLIFGVAWQQRKELAGKIQERDQELYNKYTSAQEKIRDDRKKKIEFLKHQS